MLKIKMVNNREYEVLESTAIYPSYSTARNKFEIHMKEDAMTIDEFVELFTESNTSEIHLIDTISKSDIAYYDYSIVASIGKQRVSTISVETAQETHTMELVVVLEQLTYLEKQLKQLGITV